MKSSKISFKGHSGETLAARLDEPAGEARAYALFAHCFTCSKDIPAARRIAQTLAAEDIGVLRFDFTGLGHSGGEFANTNFSSNIADLRLAAQWLADNREAPAVLIGHSLGGAAALAAAGDMASIKGVATIGAPADPEHVIHNFGACTDTIQREGKAQVTLAGREFTIEKQFLDDLSDQPTTDRIAALRKALLVLHAPRDMTVGIENAGAIFAAAKHPKSFISLDEADHLLTRAEDAEYAARVIAAWAVRFLSPAEKPEAPESGVRISESDAAGFLQQIAAPRGRTIVADEPKSVGGTDLGLTPYELVAAGLGACTAMTIRMYARRKGLALDHVEVDVEHNKIHAQDCEACETGNGKIDRFTRRIALTGELTDEQRTRLMEIADKCPVHRTLEGEIDIVTEAV